MPAELARRERGFERARFGAELFAQRGFLWLFYRSCRGVWSTGLCVSVNRVEAVGSGGIGGSAIAGASDGLGPPTGADVERIGEGRGDGSRVCLTGQMDDGPEAEVLSFGWFEKVGVAPVAVIRVRVDVDAAGVANAESVGDAWRAACACPELSRAGSADGRIGGEDALVDQGEKSVVRTGRREGVVGTPKEPGSHGVLHRLPSERIGATAAGRAPWGDGLVRDGVGGRVFGIGGGRRLGELVGAKRTEAWFGDVRRTALILGRLG